MKMSTTTTSTIHQSIRFGIMVLTLISQSTIAFLFQPSISSSTHQHPFHLLKLPPQLTRVYSTPVDHDTPVDHENNRPHDKYTRPIKPQLIKSKERSNFWYSDSAPAPLTEDQVLPYQPKLDADGPLPFGSYRTAGLPQYEPKRTCLVTAGLTFQNVRKQNREDIELERIIANAQTMIDSGFTSFQLNLPQDPKTSLRLHDNDQTTGMETNAEQVWMEENIYRRLVQETPPSVLSLCNLGTRLSIPYWNYEGSIGNGSMIRQRIGQSILNIFGHAGGCIDSLQVDFRAGPGPKTDSKNGRGSRSEPEPRKYQESMSPYTLDVMDTLQDMQREGLIRSINGVNFPASALRQLKDCGFHLDTNQVTCNILDPNDYYGDLQKFCQEADLTERPMKIIRNSPLAGGLLADKFCRISHRSRSRNGSPLAAYLTPSEEWSYKHALEGSWLKNFNARDRKSTDITKKGLWLPFENKVMETLYNIALKHRVDVAAVAVRWTMQQDHLGSVLVGTNLNARYDSERPFTRPKDLRKCFALHLDEEDMDRLWSVSGAKPLMNEYENDFGNEWGFDDPAVNFSNTNTKLWL
jgi:diketogulonate reductase-like aldo/keto reductase